MSEKVYINVKLPVDPKNPEDREAAILEYAKQKMRCFTCRKILMSIHDCNILVKSCDCPSVDFEYFGCIHYEKK